jgi:hypothetical protein
VQKNELKGKHIAILGMGPSVDAFTDHVKRLGGASAYCDEVWGVNALGDVFRCDRVFHMDDIRVQVKRAQARPKSNIANMVRWMRSHAGPIYTSHADPDFLGLVRYPLEDVVKDLGEAYFNSTVAYAMAAAIYAGAARVSIFGCDYSYEHSHHAERGRACLEYWVAIAKQRGMQISVPASTSLLDAIDGPDALFYGFCDGHKVRLQDDMSLTIEPRELPTADEIERRYDHSRPTNELVRRGVSES